MQINEGNLGNHEIVWKHIKIFLIFGILFPCFIKIVKMLQYKRLIQVPFQILSAKKLKFVYNYSCSLDPH